MGNRALKDPIGGTSPDTGPQAAPTSSTSPASPSAGAHRIADLDRVIHERVRLGIMSALGAEQSLTFQDLKRILDTSDGNLSVHAKRLEEAGYIAVEKSFQGQKPRTEYCITPTGRAALERYLDHMEALIAATRGR